MLCLSLQQFSDQIVGFVPRKHVSTAGGVYSYGSFEMQDPETAGGDKYGQFKKKKSCST